MAERASAPFLSEKNRCGSVGDAGCKELRKDSGEEKGTCGGSRNHGKEYGRRWAFPGIIQFSWKRPGFLFRLRNSTRRVSNDDFWDGGAGHGSEYSLGNNPSRRKRIHDVAGREFFVFRVVSSCQSRPRGLPGTRALLWSFLVKRGS